MKFGKQAALVAAVAMASTSVLAASSDRTLSGYSDSDQVQALIRMNRQILKNQAAADKKVSSMMPNILWTGAIESDFNYTQSRVSSTDTLQDWTLSKVELAADAIFNDNVAGYVELRAANLGTAELSTVNNIVYVNQAYAVVNNSKGYLTIGKQYLPFGRYKSNFINSDFATIAGEMKLPSIVVGSNFGGSFNVAAFTYDSATSLSNETCDSSFNDFDCHVDKYAEEFGASVDYKKAMGNAKLNVGAGYASSLAGTDMFASVNSEYIVNETVPNAINELPGVNSYFIANMNNMRFMLQGSYGMKKLADVVTPVGGHSWSSDDKPYVASAEFDYDLDNAVAGRPMSFALGYDMASDALTTGDDFNLPKSVISGQVSIDWYKGFTTALQYSMQGKREGGNTTNNQNANVAVLQTAFTF